MSRLKVVEWPAKVLETPALAVEKFDEDLKKLVADMFETMKAAGGIGLAANQVGVLKRVIVMQIPYSKVDQEDGVLRKDWHDKRMVLINPVLKQKQGVIKWQEGCLSFPDLSDFVDRAREVVVSAFDENGSPFELHVDELCAVCVQHEIDHIDGIVFFKRMSRLKAERIKSRMLKRGNLEIEKETNEI